MYAFYIARGHKLEDLVNLSRVEKMIFYEGMEQFYAFENQKLKALCGGE